MDLNSACKDLCKASITLDSTLREYLPGAPKVRPKVFRLCSGVYWPAVISGEAMFGEFSAGEQRIALLPDKLIMHIKMCSDNEDEKELISRISSATKWCKERFENIVRHQMRFIEKQNRSTKNIKIEMFMLLLSAGKKYDNNNQNIMEVALVYALQKLYRAQCALQDEMFDSKTKLRPRIFELYKGLYWPSIERGEVRFKCIHSDKYGDFDVTYAGAEKIIMDSVEKKPSKVLYVIRHILRAAEWCKKRTEGVKMHAKIVDAQQAHIFDLIKAKT